MAQAQTSTQPALPIIPGGLIRLLKHDQIEIRLQIDATDLFPTLEIPHKHIIKSPSGETLFFAYEEPSAHFRNCCGRPCFFDIPIMDIYKKEVIRLHHSCFCLWDSITVLAPGNHVIGKVAQIWNCCRIRLAIKDGDGNTVFKIRGPVAPFAVAGQDAIFRIMSKDGKQEIGSIMRQWSGQGKDIFTDADFFKITFPPSIDVTTKAVLMGAAFLIEYMAFATMHDRWAP